MSRKLDSRDIKLREHIALRMKELRDDSGKSQTEFAYEYGKDKQSQNKWEKGKGATIYTINRFCKARGITLTEFFDSPLFKKEGREKK